MTTFDLITLTFSAIGGIMTLLLGTIAYFLKKQINTIESLCNVVNELKTCLSVLRRDIDAHKEQSDEVRTDVKEKLEHHDERLNGHDVEIAQIKQHIKK